MTALWTSAEIADATGGTASTDFEVSGVSFDSREVETGHLFIALDGETTDGHRFVDGAIERGAAGVLVSKQVSCAHIRVENTTRALDDLARAARARTAGKIIGVTGSAGKTGTKEALADALARANKGTVHRSVKSYNNHTGVPLSLSRMPRDARYAVLEMGMNHAGELAELTRLVRPHVAIVTTIASAHREFFAREEDIADAKAEIFGGLEPGGTAVIPFDSPYCARLVDAARQQGAKIITFGVGDGADVCAVDVIETEKGQQIRARLPDAELSFTLSQPGAHWVSNAMAVLAAVAAVGGDLAAAGLALSELGGLAGRGAQHKIAVKGGNALIIDESYNANPASMVATLAVLGNAPATRRIAVLGEMRELGIESDALHAGLVEPIIAANLKIALLVGPAMMPLVKALEGRVTCVHVADASAALEQLQSLVEADDAILIKGSNAVGLSRLVAVLAGGV